MILCIRQLPLLSSWTHTLRPCRCLPAAALGPEPAPQTLAATAAAGGAGGTCERGAAVAQPLFQDRRHDGLRGGEGDVVGLKRRPLVARVAQRVAYHIVIASCAVTQARDYKGVPSFSRGSTLTCAPRFLCLSNPSHIRLPHTQELGGIANPSPPARSSWCMYAELSPGAQATLLHFALTRIFSSSRTAHQCDNGSAEEHQVRDMCRLF